MGCPPRPGQLHCAGLRPLHDLVHRVLSAQHRGATLRVCFCTPVAAGGNFGELVQGCCAVALLQPCGGGGGVFMILKLCWKTQQTNFQPPVSMCHIEVPGLTMPADTASCYQ